MEIKGKVHYVGVNDVTRLCLRTCGRYLTVCLITLI